jgi:hypothetical protein
MIKNNLLQTINVRVLEEGKEKVVELNLQKLINNYLEMERRNYYNILKSIRKQNFIICQKCNHLKGIEVHHIDKNRNNNTLNNLIILCKLCHYKEHHSQTRYVNYSSNIDNKNKEDVKKDYLEDRYEIETGSVTRILLSKENKTKLLFCDFCERLKMVNPEERICKECKNKEKKNGI